MTRLHYAKELQRLQDELLLMGSMVSQALSEALSAMKRQDIVAAQRLIEYDRLVNQKRYALEDWVLTLIATQQPMARDMRFLAAVLDLASELERIGDYAKGIGRITVFLGKEPAVKPLVHLPQMCNIVVEMLREALDAFINQDITAARQIPLRDDQVDELYNTVNGELIQLVIANPRLWIAPIITHGRPTTWSEPPTAWSTFASALSIPSPANLSKWTVKSQSLV